MGGDGHEQVVYCRDEASGLRAIVAIHSTRLGPALGGTRFYPYPSEEEALEDVLRLSRGMTYKAATAGLDLGGGKAVILGHPARDRSEALLRTYGRFVESLGGRYITAEDVGTTQADMDLIRRETTHVTGVSLSLGGSGDPSAATAHGVLHAMRATAAHRWASPNLTDRRVVVAGVGKVGYALARHLVEEGARVTVSDVSGPAVERARAELGVEAVAPEAAYATACDILAPCALGGTLSRASIPELRCSVVVGCANNQLTDPGCAGLLQAANVLWCPDYVANAGGIINISDELAGYHRDRAYARVAAISATVTTVLEIARDQGITPAAAADDLAERRLAAIGGLALRRPHPRG